MLGLATSEYRSAYFTGYRLPGHPPVHSPSLLLEFNEWVSLQDFYSQLGQDKWIIGEVFPGVTDGYFLDIGSSDAVEDSNSKALEELGWEGLCVDPFPRNWRDRTCTIFEEVLYSRKGEALQFRQAGVLGRIDEHIDAWEEAVSESPVIELTTTMVGEELERAGAPSSIAYVSLDTEGAEFEILKAFPFEKYRVGAWTIEPNYEEEKRREIRALLEDNGYRFVRGQLVEDWYVPEEPRALE